MAILPPGWKPPLPPPAKDTTIGGHWKDIDWEALFASDPEYHQAVIDEQTGLTTAGTARVTGIINALTKFGVLPSDADYARMTPQEAAAVHAAISPTVAAAITGNPNSEAALARDLKARGGESLRARLGASGTLWGGAQSAGENVLGKQFDRTLVGGADTLLTSLGLGETAWGNAQTDWATKTTGALGGAATRIAASDPWQWVPGVTQTENTDPAAGPVDPATQAVIDRSAAQALDPNYGQYRAPPRRQSPATRAVIARSAAMARVPKRALRLYR